MQQIEGETRSDVVLRFTYWKRVHHYLHVGGTHYKRAGYVMMHVRVDACMRDLAHKFYTRLRPFGGAT